MKNTIIGTGLSTLALLASTGAQASYKEGVNYEFIRCTFENVITTFNANLRVDYGVPAIQNLPSIGHEPNLDLVIDTHTWQAGWADGAFEIPASGDLRWVAGEDGQNNLRVETMSIVGLSADTAPQEGLTILLSYVEIAEGPVKGGVRGFNNCKVSNKAMLFSLLGITDLN